MPKQYLRTYFDAVSPFLIKWGHLERWKSTALTI